MLKEKYIPNNCSKQASSTSVIKNILNNEPDIKAIIDLGCELEILLIYLVKQIKT